MKELFAIALLVLLFFSKAFGMGYFADDYFFLKIRRISSLSGFANFFNPVKDYFYSFRPIPSEVFFWFTNSNLLFAHIIVFITFFIGLIYLYKIVNKLFMNRQIALISTFLYSINFTHVYQLYWLATYQEVCLFTFLLISFYKYLNKSYSWSWLFFVLALLSKQSAIVYPVFLLIFYYTNESKIKIEKIKLLNFAVLFLTSICFYFIYKIGIDKISTLPEYAIQLSPKIFLNNVMWYSLWSIGFPSILPDYMVSILKAPLPEFWKYFSKPEFLYYQIFFVGYLLSFVVSIFFVEKREYKKLIKLFFLCSLMFLVFILPFAFILHKWMVRLTIPLIFFSIFEGYFIWLLLKNKRFLGEGLIVLYVLFNIFAIRFHEEASTYLIEDKIFNNSKIVFANINPKINCIYFDDSDVTVSSWQGSKKLKTSYNDQSFISYYFGNRKMRAIYSFENLSVPQNCLTISSKLLLK